MPNAEGSLLMRADVAAWLARARADAESRGLTGLVPLLEALARSTSALRDADPSLTHAADAGPEAPVSEEHAGPEGPANEEPAGSPGPADTSDAGHAAR
jgi:hypothetical protein